MSGDGRQVDSDPRRRPLLRSPSLFYRGPGGAIVRTNANPDNVRALEEKKRDLPFDENSSQESDDEEAAPAPD